MLSPQGHTQYHGGNKPVHTAPQSISEPRTQLATPRNASEPAFLEDNVKKHFKHLHLQEY